MPRNTDNPFNVMKEYLIKTFDKKEYAERFLKDGEMLFRNVSYFRKIEDDGVRGDINEGFSKERIYVNVNPNLNTIYLGDKYIIDWRKVKQNVPDFRRKSGQVYFDISYIADIQIYCLTYISDDMDNKYEVISNLKTFGEYCVVIIDYKEFIDRINKILKIQYGKVHYIDGEIKSVFEKKSIYKPQSEFRIITECSEQYLLNRIGAIRGFMSKTNDTQKMLEYLF